jgi:dipeptidyl aminopeptidase/acylaminoacyl peptidase
VVNGIAIRFAVPSSSTRSFLLVTLTSLACSKVAPSRHESSPLATSPSASAAASGARANAPSPSAAPPRAPTTPLEQAVNAFHAITDYKTVAISPNASHVAYVASALDNGQPSRNSVIQLIDRATRGAEPRRVTARAGSGAGAAGMERGLAWSPDSQTLAFLSDAAEPKQLQLYTYRREGGAVTQLTKLRGYLKDPVYSPDGRFIAVLFTENASRPTGAVEAIPVPTGLVDTKLEQQRIAIVDVTSHEVRVVSPPDTFVYEHSWSADGKQIAAVAARGHGESQWWVAGLFVLDIGTGDFRAVYKPSRQIAVPRFSPDGAHIAVLEGLMSDEGQHGGDIFIVATQTGQARNVTPDRKSTPTWMTWVPGEYRLLFTEVVEGRAAISWLDPASRRSETLYTADETISARGGGLSLSVSADGKTVAAARQTFAHAEDVFAGPIGAWEALTHTGDVVKPWWGSAQSLRWASDGRKVQGWLVYPRDFDAGKKYPMVVNVHGGPASAALPGFKEAALFGLEGYFVFFPNPRGSYGQGTAFTTANVKDFGHGDLRDILAGVDEALKTAPIDKNRLAITGWSYGGFMTMWAITQTNRFRAAAAGAGIANWQSYYGQNEIRAWMIPYFGASVYDDPAVYAKSSPILHIKNAATPTLVLVGDSDGECPAAQSFEFFRALKALGVDTQLMVYPQEGHRLMNPEHRRDRVLRTVQWFNAKLNAPAVVPSFGR